MRVLISACLLGCACRYDGGSRPHQAVQALADAFELIPVCPEQLGGLPTPRTPAERRGGSVVTKDGTDVTAPFLRGAEEVCRISKLLGAAHAILKSRSPSCGSGEIYDGTFTRTAVPGDGITAEALKRMGVAVVTEEELERCLRQWKRDLV
ncbi:MAG: DUF523 domain-containing protein [Clostridia bacterium]|nr:DUF523 domain-containing protein [Clostridia bacterium]